MRAVFDHSWNLLIPREQEVFQALSVFRGGFTRQAAQWVASASLRELRSLVNKSMLQRDPAGRYGIHELLHQYAADKLGEVPAAEKATRDRHSTYYAGFLQQREAQLVGRGQKQALAEIGADIENVRAAWDWAVARSRIEDIDRSPESLAEFYRLRGWFQEGEQAFARAAQRLAREQADIASRPEVSRESRIVLGKVLMKQGRFCPLGMAEKGVELLQKSLAIFRDLGARREMAYALCCLGDESSCEEALAIFNEIGDRGGIATSLQGLAWAATYQGEYGAAKQLYQKSLAIFRELGNQEETARSLHSLGYIAYLLGETKVAKVLHQESLVLRKETANQEGIAKSLEYLGYVALQSKEYGEAKQLLQEGLAIYEEIGSLYGMACVLSALGEVANVLGEYAQAAQLAQKSLALGKNWKDKTQVPRTLRVLGRAKCNLEDVQEAKRCFQQALEMAVTERLTYIVLAILDAIAVLLVREGERERALELLSLILHHPAIWQDTRDRATPLVAELKSELPPDVVAAAWERGRARDLDATVVKLLDELGGTGTDSLDQSAPSL